MTHTDTTEPTITDDSITFAELGLDTNILRAVAASGYTKATPIQARAIPLILGGGDVTGIAQTGTGKTAAFVLPMIHKLACGRAKARMPRSLILEPTRELAAQVAESFTRYGAHHALDPALLIGGVSFADQDRKLMRGADVLIATPGRLLDHFGRGKLLLTGVQMLVIDEADRMLDMGFIPDIERICALMPTRRQTLLFSATMPPEIARLAARFQRTPEAIRVDGPAKIATGANIAQHIVRLPSDDDAARRAVLRAVIRHSKAEGGIVFCNRKREVDVVASSLRAHGLNAQGIHGDLPQSVRTRTLEGFRSGEILFLVASNVAARGLDIPDVSHVFNLAPPPNSDDYVHRIGRTGRAGKSGVSVTLIAPDDNKLWSIIVERINPKVTTLSSPELDQALTAQPRGRSGRGDTERSGTSARRPRGGRRSGGKARAESATPTPATDLAQPGPTVAPASDQGSGTAGDAPARRRRRRRGRGPSGADGAGDKQVSPERDTPDPAGQSQ